MGFVPKPNQSRSTELWEQKYENLTQRKLKLQHKENVSVGFAETYFANIYPGDRVVQSDTAPDEMPSSLPPIPTKGSSSPPPKPLSLFASWTTTGSLPWWLTASLIVSTHSWQFD